MKLYNSVEEFPTPADGCVLAIGNFDGLHLGHQAVIDRGRQLANDRSLPLVAVTFDPSAVQLLRPERAPRVLTPQEIKIRLFEELGLDYLVIIKTTMEFLSLTPAEFVERILVNKFSVRDVVEGQTFNFGHRRTGTMVSLKQLADQYGFQSHLVSARKIVFKNDTTPVALNSTLVRQLVSTGKMDRVRKCLGRDYMLAGRVVSGHGRGAQLGFPTVNLELYESRQISPEEGVFAGYARLGKSADQAWGKKRPIPTAISIGRCETFSERTWQIEAHLLDYKPRATPLHGQHLLLSLSEKIRPQQRFDSSEALTEAITKDCIAVRRVLKIAGQEA